ncbi:RHO protein GDP dissociation inhibitor [Oesophagostomum dentatum]|uniref:RHO protein GDP dissociation inhibitor n=1 Tax=Oesophagostomum dentatum TaxID=61180 RepID=A0A0B1TRH0_OESDE|nr:RHO protein GDP dissociation inhibitor [Oesophagostomum dentatum]
MDINYIRLIASLPTMDDESLAKYKATLLGASPVDTVVDPADPRIVIVKSITLLVPDRDEVKMELDNPKELGDATFKLKEGCHYRLRFDFYVQREIVTGLKYIHKVSRHGVQVFKETYMVGSYAPKLELQSYTTPVEEAPSGMLHRGKYKVKSQMTDDDGHDWLTWCWTTEISKDW